MLGDNGDFAVNRVGQVAHRQFGRGERLDDAPTGRLTEDLAQLLQSPLGFGLSDLLTRRAHPFGILDDHGNPLLPICTAMQVARSGPREDRSSSQPYL